MCGRGDKYFRYHNQERISKELAFNRHLGAIKE